uniref:Truncated GIY-YIG endonuclease n=1 Tax=Sclerotinia borealis TaxID=77105 RepID=A0A088CAF1_9HELO|nr:truncated GIY-YIG endonuclease [Sclerotinia borealis]AHX83030.1 truncated GIY-YIG endonuclease [Sclerotinia borealis]
MMHNSIADPVVKLFIKNNCLHLMSLDKYTKEINPKDFIDYPIDGPDKQGHPSLYAGKSGCYAFLCLKTGDYYVGSAICLNTRYKTHKVRSSRPERGGSTSLYLSVREHGWHNFIWRPLIVTSNYINNFIKQNPEHELSLESLFILRSLTQFEARLFEQVLLTQFRPKLNSNYTVVFPYSNKEISAYIIFEGSKPLEVRVGDNAEFSMKFSSKNRAAVSLGIPKTTLDRYINLKIFTIYSPVLEMDVYLIDPSKPLSEDSPSYTTTDGVMTITGVDLYALAKGKLFALSLDKKSLFGIYDNPSKAAMSLDGRSDSRYISRYINLERPVAVGEDKTPVYFIMNPDWKTDIIGRIAARPGERKKSGRSRSIVLVDVLNKSALVFSTVSNMSRYIGRNALTDTGYVKKYMNPTKLYKGRYEFHYRDEFTGTITGKGSL